MGELAAYPSYLNAVMLAFRPVPRSAGDFQSAFKTSLMKVAITDDPVPRGVLADEIASS